MTPRAPSGLRQSGKGLWRAVVDEHAIALDRRALKLLAEACRALDTVRDLERQVRTDGLMVPGSQGQLRLHPAVAEMRQARLAVAHLVRAALFPLATVGGIHPAAFAAGERSVIGGEIIDDQIGPDGKPL